LTLVSVDVVKSEQN